MRLTEFHLDHYGPFEATTLTLDPRPGCLNLICAPNGAGKSVLRRALGDLLFEIHMRSPMKFRFGYADMRLSARAILAGNTTIEFVRRKGHGNTLLDALGAPLDPAQLGMLPDRATLERIFALDTDLLRRGGDALLAAGGAVADALLAASGLPGARALKRELLEESDALTAIRKDGRSPFNVAITDFRRARERADAALFRPRDRAKLTDEHDEAIAARDDARAKAGQAEIERDRLQRIRLVRDPLRHHDEAVAWLAANPHAPNLPSDRREQLEHAARRRAETIAQIESRKRDLETATTVLDNASDESQILAAQLAIDALDAPAGAAAKALHDLPGLHREQAAITAAINGLLRDLGVVGEPEQVRARLPDMIARDAADRLIRAHAGKRAACSAAAERLSNLATEIGTLRRDLGALPAAAADAELASLLKEIRAPGDPLKRADQVAKTQREAGARLTAALAIVPGWSGDAEALKAVSLRSVSAYVDCHRALQTAETTVKQRAEAVEAARARCEHAATALADATSTLPIADRAAVARARSHRDAGWGLISRLAFSGTPVGVEETLGFAGSEHLALAYERAVTEADRLADLRADEGGAIARAVPLRDALQREQQAARDAETLLTRAADDLGAATAAWVAMLPAGLPVDTRLDALREWIDARAGVIRVLEQCDSGNRDMAAMREQHASWCARLQPRLPGKRGDLPALLIAADDAAEQARQLEQRRAELRAGLAALASQQGGANSNAKHATSELDSWQLAWATTLERLSRPPTESPEDTAVALTLLDRLAARFAESDRLGQRLRDIAEDHGSFMCAVARALATLGETDAPPTTVEEALTAASALKERLRAAGQAKARRDELVKQARVAQGALDKLRSEEAAHDTALRLLLQEIGADDLATARARLDLAEERARQAARLTAATNDLARHGDGLAVETLRNEVASTAEADMAAALEAARDQAAAARAALEVATASASRLQQLMDAKAAETAYLEASADQAAAAARAGDTLQDALLSRLASLLVGEALGQFEQASQAAILHRIGAWFARLTGGAFARITADTDADPPELVMIPADRPTETKRVGDLSEGTRDQLFLALRLAAIEAHPARLPFVADDILQSFDDARVAAALDALLELSKRVQVIVLTHHGHILELARRLPAGQVWECGLC